MESRQSGRQRPTGNAAIFKSKNRFRLRPIG
jgi:hypothetical protein